MNSKEKAVKEIKKDVDLRYVLAVKGAHHKFMRFKKQTEVTLCDHPKDALGFETREGAFRWIEEILLPMDQRGVWVLDKELWEVVEQKNGGYKYTPYKSKLNEHYYKNKMSEKPDNPSAQLEQIERSGATDEVMRKTYGPKLSSDSTNPVHYQAGNIQAIDVIEDFDLGFDLGNAIKYILRAGKKGSEEKDLKKAIWYIMHHLGWEPQKNQKMVDLRMTNERLELIYHAIDALNNQAAYKELAKELLDSLDSKD